MSTMLIFLRVSPLLCARSPISKLSPRCGSLHRFYSSTSPQEHAVNTNYRYINEEVCPDASTPGPAQVDQLSNFIASKRRLVVITGAGVSTESGVPDYRSPNGSYSKGHKPTTYQEFVSKLSTRKREPNPTHTSLATLEQRGMVHHLITQNVDGLHYKAGHRRIIELHGSTMPRAEFQASLQALNPSWVSSFRADPPSTRPDGDADLGQVDYSTFVVPDCQHCGGMLKPEVVFFGESVPIDVVNKAMSIITESDGVLVVGTSLQVFSIFRFIRAADQKNIPIGILNIGPTRGDDLKALEFKIEARSGQILPLALENIFTNRIKEARAEY